MPRTGRPSRKAWATGTRTDRRLLRIPLSGPTLELSELEQRRLACFENPDAQGSEYIM